MIEMVRKTLVAFLAIILLSGGATQAQAQRQSYRGTYRSVRQLILRLENRTELLRSSANQSRVYRGGGANVEGLLQDLKTAVAQLRGRFGRRAASAADALEVLNRAAQIEQLVGQGLRGSSLRNWTNLRTVLKQLAIAFNLSSSTVSRTYRDNETAPYAASNLTGT